LVLVYRAISPTGELNKQRQGGVRKYKLYLGYSGVTKLNTRNTITRRIPVSEIMKNQSAVVSNRFSHAGFFALSEKKEKKQENVRNIAITDMNSSISVVAVRLVIWSEVITKRQNPSRFTEVLRICCEV